MTRFRVYILPQASKQIDRLPGRVRQSVRRAVAGLRDDPLPTYSVRLDFDAGLGRELRRLRLDTWRVVYVLDHDSAAVYVLAVRRRPPY